MIPQYPKRLASLLCAVLLLGAFLSYTPVQAQSSTPEAIIAAVNALRASRGLAPYQVDAGLMAYAQQHTDYQASIHTSTHEHSDGTVPQNHGLQENVAGGDIDYLTPEAAVYEIWADPGHMKTMIGYSSGWIGAGASNDGTTEYYTIDVRPGNNLPGSPGAGKGTPGVTPSSPIPLVPLVTMTPRANGCTIHVVGYGQSLWAIAIAYGVKIDAIRGLNNLPAGSTDIYAGEWLVIRCVPVTKTAPASETPTPTEPDPTSIPVTALETETPATAHAAGEAADTNRITLESGFTREAKPTVIEAVRSAPPAMLAAGMLILAGGTLLVLVVFALLKGNNAAR